MKLKTREANILFKKKKYKEALYIYKELSDVFGYKIFKVNIQLCEKNLLQKNQSFVNIEQDNNINIALITDINYAMGTYVAITTIIRNANKDYVYNINVLAVDMKARESNVFYDLESNNINIHVINSHKSDEKFLIKKVDGFHVSPAAIIKFELPNTINNVDKLLYLDGDIVVNSDLVDLYKADLDSKYAAVIEDMKPKYLYRPSILKKLDIESHNAYFNSGVMLLNLKKLREDDISRKLYEYREHEKNFFMDQDAFNVVFGGKVKYLHPKNNFLTTNVNSFNIEEINSMYQLDRNYKSYSDAFKTADIVHFSSKHKPWNNRKTQISKLWFKSYINSGVYGKFGIIHEVEKTIRLNDIIVSYTSLSTNLNNTYKSIISILSQSLKPKNIILWLPKKNFPEKEASLPNNLLNLRDKGLIIEWCADDKPCNKLAPTVSKYQNQTIINADEEQEYHKDWLLEKISSFLQDNDILVL